MKKGGGGRRKGKEARTKEGENEKKIISEGGGELSFLFFLFSINSFPLHIHSVSRKLVSAFFSFLAFLGVSLIFILDYTLPCSSFFSFLLFHTDFYFQSNRNSNNVPWFVTDIFYNLNFDVTLTTILIRTAWTWIRILCRNFIKSLSAEEACTIYFLYEISRRYCTQQCIFLQHFARYVNVVVTRVKLKFP